MRDALIVRDRAAAAETMKGTIVKVDDATRTITFRQERSDKDEVLTVDGSVNLEGLKTNAKARITVDGGVVKGIEPEARPRAPGY